MSVKTGLERLLREPELRKDLKGKKLGLCCNHTAVNSDLRHAAELINQIDGCKLEILLGPEHGIWGTAQDMIPVGEKRLDPNFGVPVYSLYGESEESLRPTPEMLEGLDFVLFDIQDIGSRYYTYIYTMSYLMETAGQCGVEVWILDRPNPLGGKLLEGPILRRRFSSFVGRYPIPVRHGMTAGELALLFRNHFGIDCELRIIKMEGWSRELWYDQTGLPWVMPSPNMPTLDTATVYPGFCLLEGTNLSEGRGTTRPFELSGAPYLNPFKLAELLESYNLPGVKFRPLYFQPAFHKWSGQECGGVQVYPTDRNKFKPFLTGVAYLKAAIELGGESFAWRTEPYEFVSDRLAIDLLCGTDEIRLALEEGVEFQELPKIWLGEAERFEQTRRPYLLY